MERKSINFAYMQSLFEFFLLICKDILEVTWHEITSDGLAFFRTKMLKQPSLWLKIATQEHMNGSVYRSKR